MCALSVIMDYVDKLPMNIWTPERYFTLLTTIDYVKKFDSIIEQPDCKVKDPILAKILDHITNLPSN